MARTANDPRLERLMARAEDLPTLPAVALQVLDLCRSEETTLDDLARALTRDPALAARLLRFAGSSLYAGGEEVTTLQRATLVLGMKTVQLMALSFSLTGTIPLEGKVGAFDFREYWRRSLVRASAAHALSGRLAPLGQEESFLAGLLAEIGRVVLVRGLPDEYGSVLQEASGNGTRWPTRELEDERLGFNHLDVGVALMRTWRMPSYLSWAMARHSDPEAAAPPFLESLGPILDLAEAVTELFTGSRRAVALEKVHGLASSLFDLDRAATDDFLAGMDSALREVGNLLEVRPSDDWDLASILEQVRRELVERTMRQSQELDGLRFTTDPEERARVAAEPRFLDALTGVGNPDALDYFLRSEVWVRHRGLLRRSMGLMLIELTETGPLVTEEELDEADRALAGVLRQMARRHDMVARLSRGLFGVLLGDATPFGMRAVASRIRAEVGELRVPLTGERRLDLPVVIAAASLASVRSEEDGRALMTVVLRMLDRAREHGPGTVDVLARALQAR
jgi:HD-like signal output (HDOD) protein/GGDEF domain-containing protein